ncbi:M12 family metallo-peptidase [Chryseobacterium sp.]|uniref:M12 family metallo-peptidase n=1 Tax=Chryseobacterium sp. TaxID=1871047 RepID=UPI002898E4D2|nr:M12 family metallo-peptidase [Chryseobacterium sp.]
MKLRLAIATLFACTFVFGQKLLFTNEIAETSLSENQKITKELSKDYNFTKYYQENTFNLDSDSDFVFDIGNKRIVAKYVKKIRYSNGSFSAVYEIKNHTDEELVFSDSEGVMTGMYLSEDGKKYIFQQTDSKIFSISEVNETKINSKDSQLDFIKPDFLTQKLNDNVCSESTAICPTSTIDVLVVYTTAAKTAWGGASQSNSFIATSITNFNNALVNSGVSNVNINLVYTGEITYTESGNMNTDLGRLRIANDGFMDNVHTLRSTYGADLCALIVSTPTSSCGLGYMNSTSTNYSATAGFTVTLYSCAVSNYTLDHEMGHNMGLNHDWYVSPNTTTPCSHHHGYTNQTAITLGSSSTTSQRWRTIMAYNDECSDSGFNCSRINRWANPNVNYNGEPTGIAIGNTNPSDEAYGFARFACVVSQFMPTSILSAVETNTVEIKDFTLFPNPAQDEISIWIKNDNKYIFKVINTPGQIVLTSQTKTINLKNLTPGTYFINIYSEKGTFIGSKKFIKK